MTEITQVPNELGIYKGKVEVFNPATGRWVAKGPESTFFPKHWDRAKVLNEVKGAYSNATILPTGRWSGISPSGARIGGDLDANGNINTAFPELAPLL